MPYTNCHLHYDEVCTPKGLRKIAQTVQGIGPPLGRVVMWNATVKATTSALVKNTHAAGFVVASVHREVECAADALSLNSGVARSIVSRRWSGRCVYRFSGCYARMDICAIVSA